MATVVKAAMLIDGTGAEPIRRPSVLIAEGRFRQILAGDAADLPSDAEIIDVGDATLLPGLIDIHEHLGLRHERGYERGQMQDPEHEVAFRMAKSALEDIQAGVTSVRIVGEKKHLDVVCKKYIDSGYIPGPRVYPAGAGIRSIHGHGATATTIADGVEAVRQAVREHVFKGSHHIKLFLSGSYGTLGSDPYMTYYSRDEIRVAVEEAHRVNRKALAHLHGGVGADWAIEAGLDSIEHGALLTDGQLERMAEKGIWLVPTLSIFFHERPHGDWRPPELQARRLRMVERVPEVTRKAIQAGVKIGAGLDAWHGDMWLEMELLVKFGMSPADAIKTATRNNAELLGELDDIGTVEVGKFADLIAVDGDPLQNISATKNVCLVLRDGIRFV